MQLSKYIASLGTVRSAQRFFQANGLNVTFQTVWLWSHGARPNKTHRRKLKEIEPRLHFCPEGCVPADDQV